MNSNNYQDLIKEFIREYGEDELKGYLNNRLSNNGDTLTLIGNEGAHSIPAEYLHGEVYVVTSGNLDLSSKESTLLEYKAAVLSLIEKLKEKRWSKVYLVPTGHTTLVLQIKVIVYNILRISTVDLFYSKGKYFELDIDYRELLSNGSS